MDEATSVHWHGIALRESYYDGGAGMGMPMAGGHMPPAIEPGQTFVARFVPPDAGTFTYHSHMDDGWQLAGRLVGPLIVLPPGQRFDPPAARRSRSTARSRRRPLLRPPTCRSASASPILRSAARISLFHS